MNTLRRYKKEVKTLFYYSVNKDIDKWIGGIGGSHFYDNFKSPTYNDTYFEVSRINSPVWWLPFACSNKLYLITITSQVNKIKISTYFFIIPINFKVWWYVRKKLRKNFLQKERDKKHEESINLIKNGIDNMSPNFIKEIRKEKLIKL